jgi:hypothetical protein
VKLGCRGQYSCPPDDPYDLDEDDKRADRARKRFCRAQAAFIERRGALLAELAVASCSEWHTPDDPERRDRTLGRILAPALRNAAAAGRLLGLRAVELPGFQLESNMLRALALCTALTRLSLGTGANDSPVTYGYAGAPLPSAGALRAAGSPFSALRGLRELDLAFSCACEAAPAMASLSALTRLTRLRLELSGLQNLDNAFGNCHAAIKMTRQWSGLHMLPASLEDLTLGASFDDWHRPTSELVRRRAAWR